MLQLVNLSNHYMDNESLLHRDPLVLEKFLRENKLDGVEMMFWEPWDQTLHRPEWIHGVHLRFWPSWLDFWQGDMEALKQEFGSEADIAACYGGLTKQEWIAAYRQNIDLAAKAKAKYVVFHVSQVRKNEVFDWQFSADNRTVIAHTIDLVNELVPSIPEDMLLLFENLWWPGLTLQDKELLAMLLNGVHHQKVGVMLDTGHLLNTNQALRSEEEAVQYIVKTVENLGELKRYIKGVHLHCSLSGDYVKASRQQARDNACNINIMEHILNIDRHQPFTDKAAKEIIALIQPDFLVHEFMQCSLEDWQNKLTVQQRALK